MAIPPEWLNFEKNKVSEILEEVSYSCPTRAPIPIKDIIESYIADVNIVSSISYNFPEGVSAVSTKDMELGWLIIINGRESVERQRFSAAHELAHIALFQNQPSKVFCSREDKGWDEKLCDRFAGDILMPEVLVLEQYKLNPFPYLEDIAKIFKVSKLVAEIQLKRMGMKFQKKELAF
jgi:Zn-dependent peptidase ImmA (M78 family)